MRGGVRVYSGATGAKLYSIFTTSYASGFGSCVAGAGDVNGDGCPDIIVGAPGEELIADDAGAAWVYDGQTTWLLFAVLGATEDLRLGSYVAGVGDVNLDGCDDVIVSAPFEGLGGPGGGNEGSVTIVSGKDTSVIDKYYGEAPYAYLGSVAGAGDINQDGVPDLILGSAGTDTNGEDSGSVRVVSGANCSKIHSYCETSPNSVGSGAVMSHTNLPSLSTNEFYLTCSGVPENQFGIFFYGAHQGYIPFGNGIRCTAGRVFRLGVTKSQGSLFSQYLDLTQPPHPDGQIMLGSEWNFQCWYRDPEAGPAYFNLSDGMNVLFCH